MRKSGRILLFLVLLLAVIRAGSAAAEKHSLLLRCAGGGQVGRINEKAVSIIIEPRETFQDAGDETWTPEKLRSLPGFRLVRAALRFTASEAVGRGSVLYSLACGNKVTRPSPVPDGHVLWDVTDAVRTWLETGDALKLIPVNRGNGEYIRVEEDSVYLQLTFTADGNIPLFPLDRVEQQEWLDEALGMLEEDSPVLRQYREVAGSLVSADYPLGVPYFFSGETGNGMLKPRVPNPNSTTRYFRAERTYLYGLDCAGYLNLVLSRNNLGHVSIAKMIRDGQGGELLASDPAEWPEFLLPGDLIGMDHGRYNHIVMYIGTMRTFGWTEETAGEALPVLDMPLVIHCGGNPFYYERYKEYIRERGYRNTYPPDGGVTVSVVLPDAKNAPYSMSPPWGWGDDFHWYLVDGSPLLVFSLDTADSLVWTGIR